MPSRRSSILRSGSEAARYSLTRCSYFCGIVASFLPKELLDSLEGLPGYDAAAFEAVHVSGEQVTSIRVNPAKTGAPPAGATRVPWSSWGYYLSERPSFTMDPLFHAGTYYVQEASSMFLEQAMRQWAD